MLGMSISIFHLYLCSIILWLQVEKHKILQVGVDKTRALANEGHGIIETETHNIPLANTNAVARKLNANPTIVSSNLNSHKSSSTTDIGKPQNVGNIKKATRSSSSFFDR